MTSRTARKTPAKKTPPKKTPARTDKSKSAAKPKAKTGASRKKSWAKGKKPAKKNSNVILISIISAIAVIIVGISFYGSFYDDPSKTRMNLYFVNAASGELQAESRRIAVSGTNTETLTNLLREYIEIGPRSSSLKRSVPDSVTIETVKIIEGSGLVEVYFDGSYKSLGLTDELNCRAGLVWTLTELGFVDRVSLFVSGEELKRDNGQPFGQLDRSNVRLDSNFSASKAELRTVKLYFADTQGMGLVLEEREVAVDMNARERSVLQELIRGSSTGLYSVLAADTRIKSVAIEDGTCIVDFGADFLAKIDAGTANERLAVYAIVNTLCELSGVNSVQILIDGVKVSGGQLDISAPFEKNTEIILD